jgi:SNF2 family DNA or RNA helicase
MQITLAASIERRYGLTGTPIPNERLELWHQLAMVQPRQWSATSFSFGVRYCNGHRTEVEAGGVGGHWVFDGESNDMELKARLAGTFLRFTTEEVQHELPPMERHVVEAVCHDEALQEEYSFAQRDIVKYLRHRNKNVEEETETISIGGTTIKLKKVERKPKAVRLVCISTLIGLLSKMKQEPALQAVDEIMHHHNRLVVFTLRVATAEWIFNSLADRLAAGQTVGGKCPDLFGPVHGEMHMDERKALAANFAEAQSGIYIATMGSAGTSINSLSTASSALLVDLHWNTAILRQAEKRVHRDGSRASHVDIYYLVLRGTVDDLFMEKLREKAERAVSLAERDTSGVSLVRDLSPANSGPVDVDLLCERLMDMD